jgi:hypothetical protein
MLLQVALDAMIQFHLPGKFCRRAGRRRSVGWVLESAALINRSWRNRV